MICLLTLQDFSNAFYGLSASWYAPPLPTPRQEKENIPSGILGYPVFTMNSSQYCHQFDEQLPV